MVEELEAKEAKVQAHLKSLAEKDKVIQALRDQLAQQKLIDTGNADTSEQMEDTTMHQDVDGDEDDDRNIAGKVDAADMSDNSDEDDYSQGQEYDDDGDESIPTVQASIVQASIV